MTIGEQIKNYRKAAKLTQKKLGELSNTSERTIQQYEAGKRQPRIEQLQQIAGTLNIPISSFLNSAPSNEYLETTYLDEKLKQIGCSIGYYEEDAIAWINFPEGTLEVTVEELKELDKSMVSYLQFKLDELKKKHPKDFRPRKK
ncbi:MAG: helix-turn-helix transcriptional regulator [Dorea sp.]|jgi:transcriptional regulator with XRE-family HTH domain|nr:helix-turn-helix transcriptional regulator [Dorea sp.]